MNHNKLCNAKCVSRKHLSQKFFCSSDGIVNITFSLEGCCLIFFFERNKNTEDNITAKIDKKNVNQSLFQFVFSVSSLSQLKTGISVFFLT